MTPTLMRHGTSFKGAALYVLHDKNQATTSERLDFTATRNLGTDDPEIAWRVMAATSKQQAQLKEKAGIPNTGRKSANHVMHLILNWHPEEKDTLTQEEMMRAANGALRALKAEDRQALLAAHNDTDHPHLHIVLNRVSQEDGRILSSSKEKLALSKWAEEYEKQRGKVYCEERVTNNAARKRGEYTRGIPRVSRHIQELQAANQNNPNFDRIKEQQQKLDARLAKETRDREARRGKAWLEFFESRKQSLQAIADKKERDSRLAEQKVREEFRSNWQNLHREHREKLAVFEEREKRLVGRLQNMIEGVDLTAIFKGVDRKKALSDAYGQIASAGRRREEFLAKQKAEEKRLAQLQDAAEKARRQEIHLQAQRQTEERRLLFLAERSSLKFRHDMENAKNRHQWKLRNEERRRAFENARGNGTTKNRPTNQGEPNLNDRMADAISRTEDFKKLMEKRRSRRRNDNEKGRDGHDRG